MFLFITLFFYLCCDVFSTGDLDKMSPDKMPPDKMPLQIDVCGVQLNKTVSIQWHIYGWGPCAWAPSMLNFEHLRMYT